MIRRLALALVFAACTSMDDVVVPGPSEMVDVAEETDFGEAHFVPVDEADFANVEPLPAGELDDPGTTEEDLTDLEEASYPLVSAEGQRDPTVTCSGMGWREVPTFMQEFERRWPAVEREALLHARCGDTLSIQRVETPLDALVQMYEASAHPRYAVRFLKIVEALRASAVRNGNAFVDKRVEEHTVSTPISGARCVQTSPGRYLCLTGCERTRGRGVPLADMYLAEPVFRGLRGLIQTNACFLPETSGLRVRARRHWGFFRAVLYRRWRAYAARMSEGQFHILARYGQLGLQVCLMDPARETEACSLARERGAYLRARMIANPRDRAALLWGSSTGMCNPQMPDFSCHTIGGACDGDQGEAAHDCRGTGSRSPSTCWRTRCGVTDVSHANTVVGGVVGRYRSLTLFVFLL
jgi:hypothetical protein